MNTAEKIVATLVTPIFLMIIYMMLVMMPVQAYTEAECLRNGYPKAHVTVGLERYCSNFDGAVTVKVTKQ